MKKAIAVVGHENWGKSYTLKALAGSAHKNWIEINGKWFYVKHMSNDDIYGALYDWVKKFISRYKNDDYGLVFALCPDFNNAEKKTKKILELLTDIDIEIKFFILDKNYNNDKEISKTEISEMKKFGNIYLTDGSVENNYRANELLKFVKKEFSLT